MSRIIVVGSVNIDFCCNLSRWPEVGETVFTSGFSQTLGGKGSNQAVAAARLGGEVCMIGAIGAASQTEFVARRLVEPGLDAQLSAIEGQPTGMAFIDIGPGGENIIRLVPGANAAITPAHVEARRDLFDGAAVLLLQNEIPLETSLAAARLARAAGAVVVMDPAPSPAEAWPGEVVSAFDLLTPNAHEAALYVGAAPETPAEGRAAAEAIAAEHGCDAIVTMASTGVAWRRSGESGWRDAKKVQSVDSVAAGDCFNGALAVALAEGRDWESAVAFAASAAAVATTRPGASASLPRRDEVPDG